MANLSSRIELTISCSGLKNKDIGSLSDPMCILKMKDIDGKFEEIGRTERVESCLDPKFSTKLLVSYFFETKQTVKFVIYDCDKDGNDPDKADKLGTITVSLAEVVQGRLKKGKKLAKSGNDTAMVHVTAHETLDCRQNYVFNFIGRGLDDKDFFGKSDPFLVFYRQSENGFTPIGQTEVVENDLNPNWAPFTINCVTFCENNPHLPIKVDCFDHDADGSHDLIGSFETTTEDLLANAGKAEYKLINEKKKAKKSSYKHSGIVMLNSYRIDEDWEFSHFVQSGLQINFIVAVDFTLSNGSPSNRSSLHYFNSENPFNEYTTAIQAVGNVVQEYDADKLFPVFGFGGVFHHETSHCFPLNDDPSNPNVVGVQGLLDAYRYALANYPLSGPTIFNEIIHSAINTASHYQSGLNYFVLLIITDGAICDMDETKSAIVKASNYPMSIIIVGVGDADFESMEELDSDKKALKDEDGHKAARDIVQFVPFREVCGNISNPSHVAWAERSLAKKVLAEVPKQVKSYMKMRQLRPVDIYNQYMQQFPQHQNATPVEPPANA